MHQYPFEKLEVWHLSKELAKEIYKVTQVFPETEKYGITSQMRRAAVSVPSNIAEGSARSTNKDRAHFYQLAYSSLMELLNQLIITTEVNWIKAEMYESIRMDIENLN
ncbi:MAG: four helix bundle protein [Bacteroidota bacterium]